MGYSIDWCPTGRLLVTGDKLRRQEPDGSMFTVAEQPANEIVVDARGQHLSQWRGLQLAVARQPGLAYIKSHAGMGNYVRSLTTSNSQWHGHYA